MTGSGFTSYQSLVNVVGKLPKNHKLALPAEICKNVANFFTTRRLDPTKTRAVTCSSTSGQYSLDHCLIDSENSWWISSFGSFRNGKGEEYIEFELASTMVRLSAVHICIPPLPRGPLSVRTMRLDAPTTTTSLNAGGEWRAVTPILVVENRSGWQRIELPSPIDVQFVRVVCLSNQASRFLSPEGAPAELDSNFGAVGFFTIKFE
mmetsp:Transcript_19655/g.36688  ORF Transcript_19655/g.36688 Transcript_19655/m.36688 type:complete len:206 (-) Transcript_19655:230-847(-)